MSGLLGNRCSLEGGPNDAATSPEPRHIGRAISRSVWREGETIRAYTKNQELEDREMDQLALIPKSHPKVAKSFNTAFSGSLSNHQLSWWFVTFVSGCL